MERPNTMKVQKKILYILLSTLLLIVTISPQTSAFIAYDCTGPRLNITSFNSLSVDYCTPPIPIKSSQLPSIKLIQKSDIQSIHYKSCYITIDYLITRCSMLEDAQMVEGGFQSDMIELGRTKCASMHDKLIYDLPSGGYIGNLEVNKTIMADRILAGSIDRSGNCEGGFYTLGNNRWEKVVVQAKYKIQLSEGTAIANYKENIIILPTGTRFTLSNLYGIDTNKGEVIWTDIKQNCENEEFDTLYEGPATLITSRSTNEFTHETQTYLVESDKIAFALKKVKMTFACDIPVIQTEHPQLFIITEQVYFNRFPAKNISPYNTDLLAYVNTKFVYIENLIHSTTTSLYSDLVMKQCNLEREVLLQKLAMASYSLTEFAYTMGNGPGYTAIKTGEAIYLLKCKPVNVELDRPTACFNELPVLYNNKSHFMTPKTHTLQQYGSQIDCNDMLPSAFSIDGDWFSMNPELREIKPPQTLKPSTEWTWSYKSPEHLMNTGIYTSDTMKALKHHIMFPQEIDAAQKNLARHSMGYDLAEQRIHLKPYFDEDTMDKLIDNKLQKMWGWFVGFGNFMSGLLGIFFIWKIVMITLNTGINLTLLYQTFGWSIKLVAGVFSSITHFIMHKKHDTKNYDKTKLNKPNQISCSHNNIYPDIRRLSI